MQYLAQNPLTGLPAAIERAGVDFEQDMAHVMRGMADVVNGEPAAQVPDIRMSALRLQEEIGRYYRNAGTPVAPQASDVMHLAQSLASILAPLYDDIHSTFTAESKTTGAQSGFFQKATQS